MYLNFQDAYKYIFIACMLILFILTTTYLPENFEDSTVAHISTTAVIADASFQLCPSPCYQHCKYKWPVQVSIRDPFALDALENCSQRSTIKHCPICKKKMLYCLQLNWNQLPGRTRFKKRAIYLHSSKGEQTHCLKQVLFMSR